MDQVNLLWFLSVSMLVGSFLSGLFPMAFRLSDSKSRLLALLGSGILVGTALSIIIPEGIDALYTRDDPSLPHHHKTIAHDQDSQNEVDPKASVLLQEPAVNMTMTIGASLIIGFVLMLLIEQFSIYQSDIDKNHMHIISENLKDHATIRYTLASQDEGEIDTAYEEQDNRSPDTIDAESDLRPITETDTHKVVIPKNENASQSGMINQPNPNRYYDHSKYMSNRSPRNSKVTPTLGLVIHAAADGIALGAAATTSHRHVEMIIFIAIMLHKAPAAFSLVVLLIHKGLKHSTIRKHLMAFSLSAPIAAVLTYYGLSQSGKEALRKNNATGIAMLFSAGTFLFVATVHVLPDLIHNKLLAPKELFFLVGGAFLPLILAQTI